MTAPLYPVGLVVEGRACLVVGGGRIAAGKVRSLVASGALVTVVAPIISEEVTALTDRLVSRAYETADLDGFRLVIAATDDPSVNAQVFRDADARGVWVNSVDDPDHCSFTLPAVHRRGAVTVAVATNGSSPALARELRDRLAAALPPGVENAATVLAAERLALRQSGRSTEDFDWSGRIAELLGDTA
ncbi:MAG: putative precorrin-2 dehydrogenase [Acidimicrobiia bacterium]|nr:putative precorrin-2 dehydrogenase [Acidimicrobiia bacterium]